MPLQVHRRAGEDCPRCDTRIEAIHFKDYVMCYCPKEQTGGRVPMFLMNSFATDAATKAQTTPIDNRTVLLLLEAIQQFQELKDLKASLDASREPPVPLVAGKSGVLRLYTA